MLLIPAAPLMLVIALQCGSTAPARYLSPKRYGFNNGTIEILKFRTMRVDPAESEEYRRPGAARRPEADPCRVLAPQDQPGRAAAVVQCPAGRNVGRRPAAAHGRTQPAVRCIGRHLPGAAPRKPGITGWAQVNGWRGETDTLEKMEGRVRHDLYYIENWSVSFDLQILARTLLIGYSSQRVLSMRLTCATGSDGIFGSR